MALTIWWHSAGMAEIDPSDAWSDEALRTRLSLMPYPKRRLEARLGRWTAKGAVARMVGLDASDPAALASVLIRNALDGAPEVRVAATTKPLTIAMTDRADWAACAVVEGRTRIGCDLELVEPRSASFVRDYFTPAEQALVVGSGEHDLMANLIWSAKESALKVLRTGLRRDTRTVEVALNDGNVDGWSPFVVNDIEGGVFPGWWIRYGEFVLTIAAAAPSAPPVSFLDPPPLASAVPAHSWMEMD